ncbi:hypothetical protein [Pedococcus soli]
MRLVPRPSTRPITRRVGRLVAAAALVAVGGLTLPGGAAQAAACSGTTGVTVVIDYGASTTTSCVSGDPTSAMSALKAVATVVSPQRYPGTVVCRINGTPAKDPCIQMPPASAYWAFFHAPRGGAWTYSQSGVASYDPAPGTVIGFAFGSGGQPSSAPPARTSTPKPSSSSTPTPTPKPSSTPRTSSSTPAHSSSTPGGTSSRGTSAKGTSTGKATAGTTPSAGRTTPSATTPGHSATTSGTTSGTASAPAAPTSATTSGTAAASGTGTDPGPSALASGTTPDQGSSTTLFAGIGLVGVVGAAAAYLTHRRRSHG